MGRLVTPTSRTTGLALAVLVVAACGLKPSAVGDEEASFIRVEPAPEAAFEEPDYAESATVDDLGDIGEAAPAPAPEESRALDDLPEGDADASAADPSRGPDQRRRVEARRPRSAADTRFRFPDRADPAPSASPEPGPATGIGPPAPESDEPQATPPRDAETAPVPEPAPSPPPAPRKAIEGPVDRTGVTDTTIKIGVHAPVTGAAPLPQDSFDKSKDLYWKWLAEKGGVHGRNVEVVFRDDEYNPTSAVRACREMVEDEKVFAIVGFAGADQITACARYAESVGVPYFSGGVNEDGLAGLNRYFAISQTYSQQSDTLVNLIKNKIKKTKVAIVVFASPSVDGTLRSIIEAVKDAGGLQIVRSSRIGKNASDSELLSEAQQLRNSGAEVVYILAAPIPFIKLATNAQAQAYTPIWIGPGTTNGLQIVAQAGCPSIGDAKFLSPFPQLDAIDDLDPNYQPAYRRYVDSSPDDIGILQWGLNKVVHQVLRATGRDLSRQSVFDTLTSGKVFKTNVYPDVSYDSDIRFGAKTAHLLEADCTTRTFRTAGRFVSSTTQFKMPGLYTAAL
ncbi:MAG: ABC transporter substrate-binding protein [Acidimicrobiia bacterium]